MLNYQILSFVCVHVYWYVACFRFMLIYVLSIKYTDSPHYDQNVSVPMVIVIKELYCTDLCPLWRTIKHICSLWRADGSKTLADVGKHLSLAIRAFAISLCAMASSDQHQSNWDLNVPKSTAFPRNKLDLCAVSKCPCFPDSFETKTDERTLIAISSLLPESVITVITRASDKEIILPDCNCKLALYSEGWT